jgi:hypothetical protein
MQERVKYTSVSDSFRVLEVIAILKRNWKNI